MTTEEPVTNGAAEPKEDESAPAEKDSTEEPAPAPEMEGSSKEEAPKKAVKAKKGKKGKKGAAPTENGTDGEKKDGDIEIVAEIKKKPIKKKIPQWATLSDKALAATKPSKLAGPSGTGGITVIIDAIKKCANPKGTASYFAIKKYVQKTNPNWPKMTFKSQLRRSVDKGCVKKIKDSYKVISETPVTKKAPTVNVSKKVTKGKTAALPKAGPLEDLFPHIFTWVCEPKEASYGLIRKYLEKHYPKLSIDAPLKKALMNMVAKGQLDQITGKGASGTFQLEGGAKKTGTTYEDPIEDAIIASNEPKDASVGALRHYLSEFHKEYNVAERPKVLKNALERAEAKGWLVRVTGRGFSGTFRLGHPYIPSPRELWREEYVDPDAEKPKKPAKKKKVADSSDEEESSSDESESEEEDSDNDSDSEESEPEYVPKATKRGAPKGRSAAPAKKAKVVKKPPPKKKAAAKPAAKKSSPAKKKPAAAKSTPKKTPKKKPADSDSEESEPEYTPKPTKRGTPKAAAKSTPKKKPADSDSEESEPEYTPKPTKRGAPKAAAKSTPKKKPAAKSNKKTKSKKK